MNKIDRFELNYGLSEKQKMMLKSRGHCITNFFFEYKFRQICIIVIGSLMKNFPTQSNY